MKKVAVFIDGSNFYHKLKDLNIKNTSKFDFKGFSQWLSRKRKLVKCSYYIGVVRARRSDRKAQKMRRSQQKLFSYLESKEQQFEVNRGFLMRTDGVFHEKGVDVKLAIDLVVGAYENKFDIAIVVSSDTDLIPAFRVLKRLKKSIEYIGFAHSPSFALQKYATISRLLIKEDLEKYEFA